MAYLAKKKIKGQTYYYLMESVRIDGKPRHSKQIYLGKVDTVHEKLKNICVPQVPVYTSDLAFGDVSALYDISQRLGLDSLIDGICTKRDQGLSVGQYLLISIINRAIKPISKLGLEGWYDTTMLSRWIPKTKGALSSRRYWDNVCKWTDKEINLFEMDFLKIIARKYNFAPKCIIYDATNFFTYIDTNNTKSTLAQRGNSKEKRNDLRIIGLSLMYSREDEFPLFYQVYDGNHHDATQFAEAMRELSAKYKIVFEAEPEITLIFDRGNNSEANIKLLKGQQYVGGLKKNQCQELYGIPKTDYIPAGDGLPDISCYRTKQKVYGEEMTVLISWNPQLEAGQMQGVLSNIEKTNQRLYEYSQKLSQRANGLITRGKKPTEQSVEKKISQILSTEYMKDLFKTEIGKTENENIILSYAFSEKALEELKERELGKTVLFTNCHTWTNAEIIRAYRSAWKIEHTFKQMKDPDHIAVRPMWCWEDQKVKVHIFCCIMALRLCCLLKKELSEKGVKVSINNMLNSLSNIKQYVHYYEQRRGLKEVYSTSKYPQAEEIMDVLGLGKYELKS